jgi:hypothetical protein
MGGGPLLRDLQVAMEELTRVVENNEPRLHAYGVYFAQEGHPG